MQHRWAFSPAQKSCHVGLQQSDIAMKLGVILPSDGAGKSEWLCLDPWLAERGVHDLETYVELSPSDGRHEIAALQETSRIDHLIRAAQALSERSCGTVAWACTSGSFIGGRTMAENQVAALTRTTGVPATSASLALAAAAEELGADRVDLLSPYPPSITDAFMAFLTEMGIRTARFTSLGCHDGRASFELNLRQMLSEFQTGAPRSGCPILIPDTAINSLDLVESFETETGRIIMTANQATLWHALHLLGVDIPIDRSGALFRYCCPNSIAADPRR
jgi:maleate isomerase